MNDRINPDFRSVLYVTVDTVARAVAALGPGIDLHGKSGSTQNMFTDNRPLLAVQIEAWGNMWWHAAFLAFAWPHANILE